MHCLREVGPPGEFSAYGGMPTLRSATAEPSNYSRSFFYVTREPDVKQQQKKHSSVLDRDRVKSAKPFFVCVCVSFLLSFFPDFSSFSHSKFLPTLPFDLFCTLQEVFF